MILIYEFNINILVVKHPLRIFTKIACDLSVDGDVKSLLQLFGIFQRTLYNNENRSSIKCFH